MDIHLVCTRTSKFEFDDPKDHKDGDRTKAHSALASALHLDARSSQVVNRFLDHLSFRSGKMQQQVKLALNSRHTLIHTGRRNWLSFIRNLLSFPYCMTKEAELDSTSIIFRLMSAKPSLNIYSVCLFHDACSIFSSTEGLCLGFLFNDSEMYFAWACSTRANLI